MSFFVFAGSNGNPFVGGGWDDFQGAYATLDEALAHAEQPANDWWQVVSDFRIVRSRAPQPRDRLTRREAAAYLLQRWGIRNSEQTLARKATESKGPKFSKFGHAVIYARSDLDAYACGGLDGDASNIVDFRRR